MKNHEPEFNKLKSAAGIYEQELTLAGESTEMVENSMRLWDRRWNDLTLLLGETKKKVNAKSENNDINPFVEDFVTCLRYKK